MIKKLTGLLSLSFFCLNLIQGQTLFTYGSNRVSKQEFLKAFNKTPNPDTNRQASLQQYLDLYIKFKLKVQAAYDEQLQKDENYKAESENFKTQLIENKINEQANIDQLIAEAFKRAETDIHVSEIFIAVPRGTDSAKALEKIREAYQELRNGKNFKEVSRLFSTDETLKKNGGDIGYITVFTLPYALENLIYSLRPGQFSHPFHSTIGYHIFHNDGERPAAGKRVVSEILFATPASFDTEQKQAVAQKADSVYRLLKKGADFGELQQQYSDPSTDDGNGNFEVGVGQFTPDFENQVFALKQPGEISPLFQTAFGYHILRLQEIKPVSTNPNDVIARSEIEQRIQNDDRLTIAKKNLVASWLEQIHYKPAAYDAKELWAYTDSILAKGSTAGFKKITPHSPLFSFEKTIYTVDDWLKFARQRRTAGSLAAYPELMQSFLHTSCSSFYTDHIMEYIPALAQEMKEFNEANLLFAAMDKHVWSKAGADSTGLKNYYDTHQSRYQWGPSVSALVITAPSRELAQEVAAKIKNNPADWRQIAASYANRVNADSSRFEEKQLPLTQPVVYEKGFLSEPEKNSGENGYSFLYITRVFPNPSQRSFEEARGMVINDYQQVIENKWVASLREKYPVKVNETVFKSIR